MAKQIKDAGSEACSARERPRTPIYAGQMVLDGEVAELLAYAQVEACAGELG
jgi:hypothetical protein